jgi:hypothetical protein
MEWAGGRRVRSSGRGTTKASEAEMWAVRRLQEYPPVRSLGRESRSPRHHLRHRRPRWTYTTNAVPKDAQRWGYAMEASDNTCSLPTAAAHAGMHMRKTARFTGLGADTRACAEDTTNALWRRGRLEGGER